MGTSAAIKINGTAFYSHYDGYPEGVAEKLVNALEVRYELQTVNEGKVNEFLIWRKAPLQNAFMAGNLFEVTLEDDVEVEYSYVINKDAECGYVIVARHGQRTFFRGPLVDFIQNYGHFVVLVQHDDDILTETTLDKRRQYIEEFCAKCTPDNPNVVNYTKELAVYDEQVREQS